MHTTAWIFRLISFFILAMPRLHMDRFIDHKSSRGPMSAPPIILLRKTTKKADIVIGDWMARARIGLVRLSTLSPEALCSCCSSKKNGKTLAPRVSTLFPTPSPQRILYSLDVNSEPSRTRSELNSRIYPGELVRPPRVLNTREYLRPPRRK